MSAEKKLDQNTVNQRLRRYGDVSKAAASTAVRFVSDKAFQKTPDHDLQAKLLTTALGQLKGPLMKVAQMLATIPDAIPQEYALEFLSLQADAPSMGWPFVKRRMVGELGPEWEKKFQSFNQNAIAAASLGQVHKATALTGELLACKLQYANMESIVQADLSQLKVFLKLYETFFKALDTQDVLKEISLRLYEELDYELEAKNIQTFQKIFMGSPSIHIPKVYPDLSTKRLLTMSWLEGKKLKEVLEESQELRNKIAENMFTSWYLPLYQYGIIHGDPHLGNYSFNQDGSINLLDFGCVRRFSKTFISGVLNLYKAMEKGDEAQAVHAYESWGFQGLTKDVVAVLNHWAKLLYEPILDNRVRPIQKDHSGVSGRETADFVHTELRRLGGVKPPGEFVFMDRAAVGIGSVCMHLKAELNWYELFHALIKDFNPEGEFKLP